MVIAHGHPKSVFDAAYRKLGEMDFGKAIEALKSGLAVNAMDEWQGMFVVKQIPSHIEGCIIPMMQSRYLSLLKTF